MKFRKKPVVVEAIQWGPPLSEVPQWISDAFDVSLAAPARPGSIMREGDRVLIYTLEGVMMAGPGDWIIRGVRGELYPIKDLIFRETYESAEALQCAQQAEDERDALQRALKAAQQARDGAYDAQRALMEQTVRIRRVLSPEVRDGVDTEDIAREVVKERDNLRVTSENLHKLLYSKGAERDALRAELIRELEYRQSGCLASHPGTCEKCGGCDTTARLAELNGGA